MNLTNNNEEKHKSRRGFLTKAAKGGIAALTLSSVTASATGLSDIVGDEKRISPLPSRIKPDHIVRSVPENMVWGYYGADVPPVYRVKDGDVVEIHTVSTAGISKNDPEAFFKDNNLPIDQHAQEIIDIMKHVQPEPSGIRGHMLTGPVYIEGAEPGDTLEVRILDLPLRSNYGVNSVWPGGGGIPDAVTSRETFVYRYDKKKNTASFMEGIEIPLKPFMGVMALSPPPEMGRVSSIPPDFFGGNLDIKHLIKGTTLYLPVSVPGGLFTTGDCHSAQGNGEVSGVAIEASLSLVAKFIVHKGKALKQVRAETPTHFIAIGLDPDLDKAMQNALAETVNFIQNELGFTFNQALSIASTGVDFEVSQVVDRTLGVHAMIPKSIFTKKKFTYWS
ncbi:acetamidase/formamidase family protein [Pontibacter silvestris]|uniref:Acetamidase/formamidase family protein n=1 Tax=Pontibacter silvestris TaxID=2305183 RepID=A0ABW4WTJ5_9BACT|nr:acetamidase/formamidase family protein [Pontibacter silvestris]MCC9137713.1 acetamidase/formamidase family protein [Pontibacter silvestris]